MRFLPESIFHQTPEELNAIEESGRIKGCSNVFEVISKYPTNIQGLGRDISSNYKLMNFKKIGAIYTNFSAEFFGTCFFYLIPLY